MKKIKIITSILISALIVSCSGSSKDNKNSNLGDLKNLPNWVLDPSLKEGIAAVGIASPSKGGIKFQLPKAELDAKANIAATIQTEVSRVTKEALRSAKVNENDDVEEFFSQASKEVVKNIPLSGVVRKNIYKAEDGTLYVHMMLSNEEYNKFLQNSESKIKASLAKSKLSRENINKSQETTKEIFDELEKERAEKKE